MDTGVWIILGVLPVLLAGCTALAAVETALFGLTFQDRTRLKRESPRVVAAVEGLLARPRELLVSLLFLNMMLSTLYFVLTSILLLEATRRDAQWLGVLVSVVNLLLMTVVAEVVSKMLAARRRAEFTRALARPTAVVVAALGPLRSFLDVAVIAPLVRAIAPGRPARRALSEQELAALIEQGGRDGAIDTGEQRVLRQVIRFGSVRVREVMTPRVHMAWLDVSATAEEARSLAAEHRLTRVPVVRGEIDDEVVGLLDVKGYLAAVSVAGFAPAGAAPRMDGFLAPVVYVPERASLDKLLELLRQSGRKVALCVDEYGAVTGIVSARDVVERLVSELRQDEDEDGNPAVQMVALGEWVVPGRLPARDWAEMFGLAHDGRVSTVAGLVQAHLGRLPVVGDVVTLGNVQLRVDSVSGRVVESITVKIVTAPAEVRLNG